MFVFGCGVLQIVLCTDGLANVGLGSVDEDVPVTAAVEGASPVPSPAEAFYRRVGEFAASRGVTIDVSVSVADTLLA